MPPTPEIQCPFCATQRERVLYCCPGCKKYVCSDCWYKGEQGLCIHCWKKRLEEIRLNFHLDSTE